MLIVLFLAVLSSLAVVHSQQPVPKDISACIAPPSGQATFTILGQQGPAGPRGHIGPKGNEGAVGRQGVRGERGVKGDKGVRGEAGMVGKKGLPGVKGEMGERGVIGPVGPQGDPGLPGAIGPRGRHGVDGARGYPGYDGPHGPPGPPGRPGVRGSPGPLGATGSCNLKLSGAAYQQLIQDIRTNLTKEIRKELERDYILTPSFCNPYLVGFKGQSEEKPASSCKHIYQCSLSTAPSGYYWVTTSNGATKMYCAMDLTHCGSTTGGWTRVAYINITDPTETCPHGLSYISTPKRMCGRSISGVGCSSVTLPSYEGSYTKVCGRALGYQYYDVVAFYPYHRKKQYTLDSYYMNGVSVTYGNYQHHIWSFVAGATKVYSYRWNCPCAPSSGLEAPPFIGNNYFCEAGANGRHHRRWYLDDPLWDGKGCARGSTCCDGPNRPWFYRELDSTVTERVEVRKCAAQIARHQDVGLEELEIYIQ